jgi:ribosome biogenesis GTPase / thiamine phosphate phosphatase
VHEHQTALAELGWGDDFQAAFAPLTENGHTPARVATQSHGIYRLLSPAGEHRAELAGRLRHAADADPAVGDWVAADLREDGTATIHAVLPRRTKFSRKVASGVSDRSEEQIVAANVDTVFIVQALGHDANARRLERYLTMAWESGARPVVVLTKADLHPDEDLSEIEAVTFGVDLHVTSAVTGEGVPALAQYLGRGQPVALLGSSGVGKSTLVNSLAGQELLATAAVRESDERGRHTTTHRELVPLPDGGLLLDTPGMRELQLWESSDGLEQTFTEIVDLIAACRFSDCEHRTEPGCAIRQALDDGSLPQERWDAYCKLQRELRALEIRHDAKLKSDARKERRRFARAQRKAAW